MQHVRYEMTHLEGHCPANDAELLGPLLEKLSNLGTATAELSDGRATLVYQEYDRNGHFFAFGIQLNGLRVEQGGDILKKAVGLKKVTLAARTFETIEQAGEALTAKLAELEAAPVAA